MPLRLTSRTFIRAPHLYQRIPATQTTRSFIDLSSLIANSSSSSSSPTQHLTATRTLPYAVEPLYTLIADVDSYSSFVPYCSYSRVTQYSSTPPDPTTATTTGGARQPELADLRVGWGSFDETFTSRLRCVPGVSVEATSGGGGEVGDASVVFRSLVTKWTLERLGDKKTGVHLDIKFQFTSPWYAAVSAAVSDKVATAMIVAFEEQAKKRFG